jgi:hypothetical protein
MRRLILVLAAAATLGALASLAPLSPAAPSCAGAGSHRAAIVVQHGDGSIVARCVAFDTAEISGEELLNRSGIAWSGRTFGSFGQAVCALDGEPARYAECPGRDDYWAVFVARGVAGGASGSWQLAAVGISGLVLHDGDAEGFRYVPASGTPAAPAPPAGVCAAATFRPTASRPATSPRVTASAAPASGPSAAPAATESVAASTAEAPPAPSEPAQLAATSPSPPSRPSGPDPGLMAAAAAGGGLAGLAVLRLVAARRPRR